MAKGWYSRHYLPHFDQPGLVQAITFRLADSVPRAILNRRDSLAPDAQEDHALLLELLDRSLGGCALRNPEAAVCLEDALLFHDGVRYRLLAWVVMPNHVHALIETLPDVTLDRIVATWKSYSARKINAQLGRSGALWQSDYHDRYVRNEVHLERAVLYVHNNPVMAGLVTRPADWPWSSARRVEALDATYHVPFERAPE
jgi:putative transposase